MKPVQYMFSTFWTIRITSRIGISKIITLTLMRWLGVAYIVAKPICQLVDEWMIFKESPPSVWTFAWFGLENLIDSWHTQAAMLPLFRPVWCALSFYLVCYLPVALLSIESCRINNRKKSHKEREENNFFKFSNERRDGKVQCTNGWRELKSEDCCVPCSGTVRFPPQPKST
jgi:hypothetical protein